MRIDPPLFVVQQPGERTIVRLQEWQSLSGQFHPPTEIAISCALRSQLEELLGERECKTLAIDVSSICRLPSAFLGILIALFKGGTQIELLNPSPTVREALEVSKLDQLFAIRD